MITDTSMTDRTSNHQLDPDHSAEMIPLTETGWHELEVSGKLEPHDRSQKPCNT